MNTQDPFTPTPDDEEYQVALDEVRKCKAQSERAFDIWAECENRLVIAHAKVRALDEKHLNKSRP